MLDKVPAAVRQQQKPKDWRNPPHLVTLPPSPNGRNGWKADISKFRLDPHAMKASKQYTDELQRALARPDANRLVERLDAYEKHLAAGKKNGWPDEYADDFFEVLESHQDPDKALAYLALALARSDDASFLGLLGCGPLEDLLDDPSAEVLERVVAEARKSARFRWLLSNPFKIAIAERAWEAIKQFRITGEREEPSYETLPPRNAP